MTETEKAKLAAMVSELQGLHKAQDKTIAEMMRVVLQVLTPQNQTHWSIEQHRQYAKNKAALPSTLIEVITMLEKE